MQDPPEVFPAVGSLMLMPVLVDTQQEAFDARRPFGSPEHITLPSFLKSSDNCFRFQKMPVGPAELGWTAFEYLSGKSFP